jgi:hypothetical protein
MFRVTPPFDAIAAEVRMSALPSGADRGVAQLPESPSKGGASADCVA